MNGQSICGECDERDAIRLIKLKRKVAVTVPFKFSASFISQYKASFINQFKKKKFLKDKTKEAF